MATLLKLSYYCNSHLSSSFTNRMMGSADRRLLEHLHAAKALTFTNAHVSSRIQNQVQCHSSVTNLCIGWEAHHPHDN
ncbi:hypothetical protein TNCV_891751 [Trichonephila clavipes]|nr:hypothetical protein TNCV_891751 [Trichonephila clavipes]